MFSKNPAFGVITKSSQAPKLPSSEVSIIDTQTGLSFESIGEEIGGYLFPKTPCGILPFYINKENEIVWGCVETDRIHIKSTLPPTGTQDIIAINGEERICIEASKPLIESNKLLIKPLILEDIKNGKILLNKEEIIFNEKNYQPIIARLKEAGYQVFLENKLATSIHETFEENGIDLRLNGRDEHLLLAMYDFPVQPVKAKRGMTIQKIYAAYLAGDNLCNDTDIALKTTLKVEEKVPAFKGNNFYEKGIWCTLQRLKELFEAEKSKYTLSDKKELTEMQQETIAQEFGAWESRIELIEKIEASIIPCLDSVNSIANKNIAISFDVIEAARNFQTSYFGM
jgi:hypothetical protein